MRGSEWAPADPPQHKAALPGPDEETVGGAYAWRWRIPGEQMRAGNPYTRWPTLPADPEEAFQTACALLFA